MSNGNSDKVTGAEQNRGLFMFSIESFSGHNGVPNAKSQFSTGAVIILILMAIEMSLRQFFASIKVRKWSKNFVYCSIFLRNSIRSSLLISSFSCSKLPGFPSSIGKWNQSTYFGPTYWCWYLELFRSCLPRMEGAVCGTTPCWRHYWREKECYAGCLRRPNVYLSSRMSTFNSLFCCISNQEYIRHNCLEWWHTIYRPPHSHATYLGEFYVFS